MMQYDFVFAVAATVFVVALVIVTHRARSRKKERFMFDLIEVTFGRKVPPRWPHAITRRAVAARVGRREQKPWFTVTRVREALQVQ